MKKLFLSVVALLCATLMFALDNASTEKSDNTSDDVNIIQKHSEQDSEII